MSILQINNTPSVMNYVRIFRIRFSANLVLVYAAYGWAESSFSTFAKSLMDFTIITGVSLVIVVCAA